MTVEEAKERVKYLRGAMGSVRLHNLATSLVRNADMEAIDVLIAAFDAREEDSKRLDKLDAVDPSIGVVVTAGDNSFSVTTGSIRTAIDDFICEVREGARPCTRVIEAREDVINTVQQWVDGKITGLEVNEVVHKYRAALSGTEPTKL